jgi:hypothetical protein
MSDYPYNLGLNNLQSLTIVSAAVNINATLGQYFELTVVNNSAFTINNPTGGLAGQSMTLILINASSGTMGTITWGTEFILGANFRNPGNGVARVIKFRFDGTNWYEETRTTGQDNLPSVQTPTYTMSMGGQTLPSDPTLGGQVVIGVLDNGAFTISNPSNAMGGQSITYCILNSSGGSMGTITWGTQFKLAGAFSNPANGKRRTIRFFFDGTYWIEEARAAADI